MLSKKLDVKRLLNMSLANIHREKVVILFAACLFMFLTIPTRATDDFFQHPALLNLDFLVWSQELEDKADQLKNMTDTEIMHIVPKSPGSMVKQHCPACGARYKENKSSFVYNPLVDPDHFTHITCGQTFPDNPSYPQDHTIDIRLHTCPTHPPGHPTKTPITVTYRYWQDPTDPSVDEYLDGLLDTIRQDWLPSRMQACGKMYLLLRDSDPIRAEEYAHAAAVAMKAFADAVPRYPMVGSYGANYVSARADWPHDGHTKDWTGSWDESRWLRRKGTDLKGPPGTLEVMDMIINSDAIRNYSDSVSGSLGDIVAYIWEGCNQEGYEFYSSLMGWTKSGQNCPGTEYKGVSLVYEKIDLLRMIPQALEKTPFYMGYTADGLYLEGPGYAGIQMLNMTQMHLMDGYYDPEWYTINPPEGIYEIDEGPPHNGYTKYENFQYPTPGPYEDFFKKTFTVWEDFGMPDGGNVIWNDAGHFTLGEASFAHRLPRERSDNVMLYGAKHVMLGDGIGDRQVQVHMDFGTSKSHTHEDMMDMELWAHGHYLLNEYPRDLSTIEWYHQTTMAHNTVVLNSSISSGDVSGDPLLYEPTLPGLSVVRAGASRAYKDQGVNFARHPNNYARTLILNTVDIERPYVVDIFRVKGESTNSQKRDYILRGSTMHRETASISIPSLTATTLPDYEFFFFPKKAAADRDFTVNYVCNEPWPTEPSGSFDWPEGSDSPENTLLPYRATENSWADEPAIGTKHHVIGRSGMEVYMLEVPWLERCGNDEPRSNYVNLPKVPQMMLRHQTSEQNETLFTVVHEPWKDAPKIIGVKEIDIPDAPGHLIALEIAFSDRTDRLYISTTDQKVDVTYDDVTFSGRVGMIAEANSGAHDAYLLGGTTLRDTSSAVDLNLPVDRYTGTINNTLSTWYGEPEPAFVVPENTMLPTGRALEGSWILLGNYNTYVPGSDQTGGGWCFEIDRIVTSGGKTTIYLKNESGLIGDSTGLKELHIPHRTFTGPTTYTIYPAISNQGQINVSPPGGAFLNPIDVTCTTSAVGGTVQYSLNDGTTWQNYTAPITLSDDATLLVRSVDADGIKLPQPQKYEFTFALEPDIADVAGFTNGLLRERRDSMSGTVDDTKIKHTFDVSTFLQNELIPFGRSAWFTYRGYIKVPADGIYTFHYRPDLDGSLKVSGKMLLPMQWYLGKVGNPKPGTHVPRSVDVALKQGLHEIEMVHYIAPQKRYTPSVDFEWESDAMPRRKLTATDFFVDAGPLISIASPLDGADVPAGDLQIYVDVTDLGGSVTRVEFHQGLHQVGVVTEPPYIFSWSDVPAGRYQFTATAYYASGIVATSEPVTLTVSAVNTLLDDPFENGNIATGGLNGGFDTSWTGGHHGENPPIGVSETDGVAVIDAGGSNSNWAWAQITSINSFDAGGLSLGFTARYEVTSWEGTDRDVPCLLALRLDSSPISGGGENGYDGSAIAGLTAAIDNKSGKVGLFAAPSDNSSIDYRDKLFEDGAVNKGDLENGFTIDLKVDSGGWLLTFTGAESVENASGNWDRYDYDDIFSDTTYLIVRTRDGTDRTAAITLSGVSISARAKGTPPAAPTGLSAVSEDSLISLNWFDNSEAELASYCVYRSLTPGGPYDMIAGGVSNSDYDDTEAVTGTIYYYVVTAVTLIGGVSAYSSEVSGVLSPSYDIFDFETISTYWLRTDCAIDSCEVADFDGSGNVGLMDLYAMIHDWLK